MDIEVLYWYWMVLGLILIVAEIFIPSFTILWFGIGAMLVGMTMLVVDISFTIQYYSGHYFRLQAPYYGFALSNHTFHH